MSFSKFIYCLLAVTFLNRLYCSSIENDSLNNNSIHHQNTSNFDSDEFDLDADEVSTYVPNQQYRINVITSSLCSPDIFEDQKHLQNFSTQVCYCYKTKSLRLNCPLEHLGAIAKAAVLLKDANLCMLVANINQDFCFRQLTNLMKKQLSANDIEIMLTLAFKYYYRASELGSGKASYKLAKLSLQVDQWYENDNLDYARLYLIRSIKQGYSKSQKKLEELNNFTPQQIDVSDINAAGRSIESDPSEKSDPPSNKSNRNESKSKIRKVDTELIQAQQNECIIDDSAKLIRELEGNKKRDIRRQGKRKTPNGTRLIPNQQSSNRSVTDNRDINELIRDIDGEPSKESKPQRKSKKKNKRKQNNRESSTPTNTNTKQIPVVSAQSQPYYSEEKTSISEENNNPFKPVKSKSARRRENAENNEQERRQATRVSKDKKNKNSLCNSKLTSKAVATKKSDESSSSVVEVGRSYKNALTGSTNSSTNTSSTNNVIQTPQITILKRPQNSVSSSSNPQSASIASSNQEMNADTNKIDEDDEDKAAQLEMRAMIRAKVVGNTNTSDIVKILAHQLILAEQYTSSLANIDSDIREKQLTERIENINQKKKLAKQTQKIKEQEEIIAKRDQQIRELQQRLLLQRQ